MATMTCPSCGAPLTRDEAHDGRCGVCLERLPSPIRSRPLFRDEDETEPAEERRRWREPDDAYLDVRKGGDWSRVRAGLGVLIWGTVGNLVTQGLSIIPNVMQLYPQLNDAATALGVLMGLAQLATVVVVLVGMILAVLPPRGSGLRALGIWALVLTLVSGAVIFVGLVAAGVVAALAGMREPDPEELILVGIPICLGLLLAFAATLLFFLYLRGVARHFGSNSLGTGFIAWFIVSTVLMVLLVLAAVALVIFLAQAPAQDQIVGVFVLCGMFVASLGLTIWLVVLFHRLRKVIAADGADRDSP